jgi:hypothetical protein
MEGQPAFPPSATLELRPGDLATIEDQKLSKIGYNPYIPYEISKLPHIFLSRLPPEYRA